jgi:hypothetical protein
MYFKFEGRTNYDRHLGKDRRSSTNVYTAICIHAVFAEWTKNCGYHKRKILPSVHINYAYHNDF